MKLLLFLGGLVLLTACSVESDRFRGNAEAYSGYRPKDGKYFWVDAQAKCQLNQTEVSGYRAVVEVIDGNKFRYRKACETNSTEVTASQVMIALYGPAQGVRKEGVLALLGGLFDRMETPPDATAAARFFSSRALVRFKANADTYDVLVRAKGTVENPIAAQGYVLPWSGVTSEVAVVASSPNAETRVYTGQGFNLLESFTGNQFLSAKFTGILEEAAVDLSSNLGTDTYVSPPAGNSQSNNPVAPPASANATGFVAGFGSSCGVFGPDNDLRCWGKNNSGQLGIGSTTEMWVPSKTGLIGVAQFSLGANHGCAIAGGKVYCWGSNALGQLGTGAPVSDSLIPKAVDLTNATAIVAANSFSCAINNGKAYCWGNNTGGQLGLGTTAQANAPMPVTAIPEDVVAISAGSLHVCAITVSRDVYCWGVNLLSQLGLGTPGGQYSTPQKVNGLKLDSISANSYSTCGVSPAGKGICWGHNQYGAVSGDGVETSTVDTPREVTGLPSTISALSLGQQFGCALAGNGVYCWGSNFSGATGIGTTAGYTPVRMVLEKANSISCGGRFCLAVVPQTTKGWGSNSNGQLGNNSTTSTNVPIDISY